MIPRCERQLGIRRAASVTSSTLAARHLAPRGLLEEGHVLISIKTIKTDAAALGREKIHPSTVDDYAESLKARITLPPVTVFVNGTGNWLADGLHRLRAHEKIGAEEIPAEVKTGGLREATLWALGANSEHGLPRTRADKQKAVETLLADPEWGQWADAEIASVCKVSREMVRHYRKATFEISSIEIIEQNDDNMETLANSNTGSNSRVRKFTDSRGRTNTMRTGNIARRIIPPAPEMVPDLADELSEARKTIVELSDEIDSIALSALPESELTAKIKKLQAELDVTRKQRDAFMKECGELKRHNAALQRKIKGLAA